jgi:hypothetical protein
LEILNICPHVVMCQHMQVLREPLKMLAAQCSLLI